MADFHNLAFGLLEPGWINARWEDKSRQKPFNPNSTNERTQVCESYLNRPQEYYRSWDKDAVQGDEGPRVKLDKLEITFIWWIFRARGQLELRRQIPYSIDTIWFEQPYKVFGYVWVSACLVWSKKEKATSKSASSPMIVERDSQEKDHDAIYPF